MLENVWPKVLAYLLDRSNISKGKLARDAGITPRTLSRYFSGENTVKKTFNDLAKGFKLTPGQLGYVYARFLLKFYRVDRFDLGPELEGDIKEPAATYDPPTARERAQTLVRLDTRDVPPNLAPSLSLMRKELQLALDGHDSAIKDLEKHLLRLVELYEEMFKGAMDVWKEMNARRGK